MALYATHIKFALDLKNKYSINNLEKYIAGVSYPDSRYLTKIDRELTHDIDRLGTIKCDADFGKGWHNHLICDKIQGTVINKLLPNEFDGNKNELVQGNEFWQRRTAVKIIQEIQIFKSFNIQLYLPLLNYAFNPNNEDISLVKEHNHIVQKIYKNKKEIKVNDIFNIWQGLGMAKEMINKIEEKTEGIMNDKKMVSIIRSFYPAMIRLFRKDYF